MLKQRSDEVNLGEEIDAQVGSLTDYVVHVSQLRQSRITDPCIRTYRAPRLDRSLDGTLQATGRGIG